MFWVIRKIDYLINFFMDILMSIFIIPVFLVQVPFIYVIDKIFTTKE